MFSIFDYLRRRTCDAFLAGAYDAIEVLQSENAVLPAFIEDSPEASKASSPNLPGDVKNGVAPKILPLAGSVAPAKTVAEQKAVSPAGRKYDQKPHATAPAPQPNSQSPPSSAALTSPTPQTDLFAADSRREQPLPPRRRGRPRKNPPEGNAQ